MRSINELVGIIQGINYDGIINEQEVMRLEKWLQVNRNLLIDEKGKKIISFLDEILEDHKITEEERTKLISNVKELDSIEFNLTSKLYELNGIMDGIICDGVVNKDEIEHLELWMSNNQEVVKRYDPCKEMCKMINEILADGVVTEEEQNQVIEICKKRIESAKLETKIEDLKNKIKNKENIGIDLIQILSNRKLVNEIHSRAQRELNSALNSYTCSMNDPEIVAVSTIIIGLEFYDGNFYDYVEETYKELYDAFGTKTRKIENLIRNSLDRFRIDDDISDKGRSINFALENAIVPIKYLPDFFDFIFDIYKLNFECDLTNDLYDDFAFIYEGLRSSLNEKGDELQLNVTHKSYKLIQTTKRLIKDKNRVDPLIRLSIMVVEIIDNKYWGKINQVTNAYLLKGFEKWISNNASSFGNKESKHKKISHWEPKFYLSNEKVYLVPPVHRINNNYNFYDIKIVVYNDEEVLW